MVKLISLLTLFLFNSTPPEYSAEGSSKLTIELSGIRNEDGNMLIFLYNYENQWPDNPYRWYEVNKPTECKDGKISFTIDGLKKGKYAISLLDDENRNEDLDRFFGLPEEGYGFSNNVKPMLSLPDYNDILFNLNSNSRVIRLNLQYVL